MPRRMMNRRNFLSLAVQTAALGVGARSSALAAQELLHPGPSWLELNGHRAGWATVRGGDMSVLRAPLDRGPNGSSLPTAPIVHLNEIEVAFGRGMSAEYYHWLESCIQNTQPAPATLDAVRGTGNAQSGTHWNGVYLTRFYVPELDRAAKDAVHLEASILVEKASDWRTRLPERRAYLPVWRRSQFNLRIPGAPSLQSHLRGIGALEFKRPLATNVLNSEHKNTVRAGAPILPTLRLRLEESAQTRLRAELMHSERRSCMLELVSEANSPWLRIGFQNLALREQEKQAASGELEIGFTSATISCGSSVLPRRISLPGL